MVYCIWYPSGGFGHFVNGVLTLYGENFAKNNSSQLEFSHNGNAHSFEPVVPKYFHDPVDYKFDFNCDLNYSVLVDNGINNEGEHFVKVFPEAKIIKLCYDDYSWPIVARTMIDKAMKSNLQDQLTVDQVWTDRKDWAVREKYFLFLRDNQLRHAWRPNKNTCNLMINDMLEYHVMHNKIQQFGIHLKDFSSTWHKWHESNLLYLHPINQAQQVVDSVKHKTNQDLAYMSDLWEQAVLYYYLWLEFEQEVPHNDFADFFANSQQISQWLKL